MTRSILLAPLLLLAACGSDEPTADNSANMAVPLPAGPMLGGVDLAQPVRASGVRPFWSLELAPGRIALTEFEGQAAVTDLYPVSPQVTREQATYTTQTPAGVRVVVTLTRARCLEGGKPVVEQPLTAEVRLGARVLKGCARSAAALGVPDAARGKAPG